MNYKDNIKKYNDLLIKFLNDLVTDIENGNSQKERQVDDMVKRLRNHISIYDVNYDDAVIKVIMTQAFQSYAVMLRNYFDSSSVHRIDEDSDFSSQLIDEMNLVTSDLTNAVNNMNKTTFYKDLIRKIKDSIIYQFKNPEIYQQATVEIEKILDDVVVDSFNIYIETKIEDFMKNTLPQLYRYIDELTRLSSTDDSDESGSGENVNLERDKFINETMDIEIHEGMENGVVTLTVIDSMGEEKKYYGNEAMEKLTSYNQLFESSRPGKKVDTSHWPPFNPYADNFDTPSKTNSTSQLPVPNNLNEIDVLGSNIIEDNTNEQPQRQDSDAEKNDSNNIISNDEIDQLSSDINNSAPTLMNLTDEFNNLTMSDDTFNNTQTDLNGTINNHNSDNDKNISSSEQLNNTSDSTALEEHLDDNSDELSHNDSNKPIDSEEPKYEFVPTEDFLPNDNSFLATFNNPNSERDDFIKRSTGITLEEDKDNQGKLYLRVIEPSGHEVIYTGKDAINMIRKYNQAYLDAYPNKKVDTTLIDNYQEN